MMDPDWNDGAWFAFGYAVAWATFYFQARSSRREANLWRRCTVAWLSTGKGKVEPPQARMVKKP